jgi:hypothetical protein
VWLTSRPPPAMPLHLRSLDPQAKLQVRRAEEQRERAEAARVQKEEGERLAAEAAQKRRAARPPLVRPAPRPPPPAPVEDMGRSPAGGNPMISSFAKRFGMGQGVDSTPEKPQPAATAHATAPPGPSQPSQPNGHASSQGVTYHPQPYNYKADRRYKVIPPEPTAEDRADPDRVQRMSQFISQEQAGLGKSNLGMETYLADPNRVRRKGHDDY